MTPFANVSETHSAVVFFAGDRAYKLKKPVRLDCLDFQYRRGSCCGLRQAVGPQGLGPDFTEPGQVAGHREGRADFVPQKRM
jgi:hypothetical protein